MRPQAVEENTGWQVALEIAREWNKNVQRLCKAVLTEDHKTAKLLAEGLLDDEESANEYVPKACHRQFCE